jgi:hypothetical protein
LLLDRGLAEALAAAVPVHVETKDLARYDADVEAAVYFCCVEALQNVAKHCGAGTRAHLRLTETSGGLDFVLTDDGPGFDPSNVTTSRGITGMRDRLEAIGGRLETFGPYAITSMRAGDVYRTVSQGGGGYGDPIDRDPSRVALDVDRSLVSATWADRVYGVVLARDGGVDAAATAERRDAIRAERRAAAEANDAAGSGGRGLLPWEPEAHGQRLNESLFYDLRGEPVVRCRCGHELGPASAGVKHLAAQAVFPVQRIGPEVNPTHWNGERFELREFYCPGCFTLVEIEIARPHEPLLDDVTLTLGAAE